tara:strand:+ start:4378 stop:5181 length:804 start_codon:yes stop_codon:yes gene_type:complete
MYSLNNSPNSSSFNSIENKHLLWQLLYENNAFVNIPDNQINNVKNIFEEKINFINNNENTYTLTEKNKKLIKEMMSGVNIFKKNVTLKPLEEVEIKISKDFEEKKEEMFSLLKKPSKESIDFNQGIDNPINNEDMENILSEMIKKRDIDIQDKSEKKNKKVEFNLNQNSEPNDITFLNKLKRYDKQDNTLDNTLDNTVENTPDNTLDNTVENTPDNTVENTLDNTVNNKQNINNENSTIINMLKKVLLQQDKIMLQQNEILSIIKSK